MGFGTFFKSLVDKKVLGEETVKKQQEFYKKYQENYPGLDPHSYLQAVWISRMAAHGKDPNDPALKMVAGTETFLCACVPPPHCATALGLYILFKESPHVIKAYPYFGEEFNRLMNPVLEAQKNGTIEELYKQYNPNLAKEMSSKD
jgi:hypothetical protein